MNDVLTYWVIPLMSSEVCADNPADSVICLVRLSAVSREMRDVVARSIEPTLAIQSATCRRSLYVANVLHFDVLPRFRLAAVAFRYCHCNYRICSLCDGKPPHDNKSTFVFCATCYRLRMVRINRLSYRMDSLF